MYVSGKYQPIERYDDTRTYLRNWDLHQASKFTLGQKLVVIPGTLVVNPFSYLHVKDPRSTTLEFAGENASRA